VFTEQGALFREGNERPFPEVELLAEAEGGQGRGLLRGLGGLTTRSTGMEKRNWEGSEGRGDGNRIGPEFR